MSAEEARAHATRTVTRAFRLSLGPALLGCLAAVPFAPELLRLVGPLYYARDTITALVAGQIALLGVLIGALAERGLRTGSRRAPTFAVLRGAYALAGTSIALVGVLGGGAFLFLSFDSSDVVEPLGSLALLVVALVQLAAEVTFLLGAVRAWRCRAAFASGPVEPRSTRLWLAGACALLLASLVFRAVAESAGPPPAPRRAHDPAGSNWGFGGR